MEVFGGPLCAVEPGGGGGTANGKCVCVFGSAVALVADAGKYVRIFHRVKTRVFTDLGYPRALKND